MKRTSTAVVWALRSGETAFWPAEWSAIHVEQSVLLLQTEPRDVVLGQIHDLLRVVAVVGPVRGAVIVVALREDEDVVTATEGVLEDGSSTEVYI